MNFPKIPPILQTVSFKNYFLISKILFNKDIDFQKFTSLSNEVGQELEKLQQDLLPYLFPQDLLLYSPPSNRLNKLNLLILIKELAKIPSLKIQSINYTIPSLSEENIGRIDIPENLDLNEIINIVSQRFIDGNFKNFILNTLVFPIKPIAFKINSFIYFLL